MFAKMPAKMEKQIMGLLENICLGLDYTGVVVLTPGQDRGRMLYNIKDESGKTIVINGIPLNGSTEREFTLGVAGKNMTLKGFGDDGADIELSMASVDKGSLPKNVQSELKKLADNGDLDLMSDEFKALL